LTGLAIAGGRGRLLFERNLMVYRRTWMVIFSGVFEPLFYLFSMGIGLGHFVGKVPGPGGRLVDYASFVAPALLASAAMNGAVYDASNVFWKMKYAKVYDAVLATPVGPADVAVGETAWALFRGFLYAVSFMVVAGALGLVESVWGLLALPGAVLIGFDDEPPRAVGGHQAARARRASACGAGPAKRRPRTISMMIESGTMMRDRNCDVENIPTVPRVSPR